MNYYYNRRRPISQLVLQLRNMNQNLASSQSLGAFPSPGVANYQDNKGWSSERIPHPSGSSRRHISGLTPFYSGRALPSKWEDAERWISSPALGYGVAKNSASSHQSQRRIKSKSGPIVPPPLAYYQNCSPSIQVLDGGSVMANSPFSTGVLMPNGVGVPYSGGGGRGKGSVGRYAGHVRGWSDLVSEVSSSNSQDECADEKVDGFDVKENKVTRSISRRDMATQMSPDGSRHSSPRRRSSSPPSISPAIVELQNDPTARLEIREVQVDKRATIINRSKRHGSRIIKKRTPDTEDFNQLAIDDQTSPWDITEVVSDFSKVQREGARIIAWENLQKAKAEAAIRKLEMKLEKKRSFTMDKILNKLRTAQLKAQEMRSSVSAAGEERELADRPHKIASFRRNAQLRSLTSCFICGAS